MPDQLKKLYRGTVDVASLTGAQYATLLATNSTTQAVIKDVVVGPNTFPATPNLQVDGLTVAPLAASVSGDQIVDVSSTVRLAFPSPLVYTSDLITVGNGTTTTPPILNYTINSINQVIAKSTSTTLQTSVAFNGGGITGEYAFATDGDFFYFGTDGNSNTTLYKRAGGINGTETAVEGSGYAPKVFDGVRYYYCVTSQTNLRRFDIETETFTNTTIQAFDPPTTSARLMFSNGYLCYLYTPGAYPVIIQCSTGNSIRLTGFGFGSSYTNLYPGFHFDPVNYNFSGIYFEPANGLLYRRTVDAIGTFSVSATSNATGPGGGTFAAPQTNSTQSQAMLSRDVFITRDPSGFQRIYTWGTTLIPNATALTSVSSGNVINKAARTLVTTPTATDFPVSIDLGVYGVQVTP